MKKILPVFKPAGFTSFEIVDYAKSFLPPKVKVGHAGTLDPLAEGVLVLGIGKATKDLPKIKDLEKEYTAILFLGAETETLDRETKPKFFSNKIRPKKEEVIIVLEKLKGEILQLPPKFSALKVKGKRAYRLAREGKEVNLKPRKVLIKEIDLLFYSYPFLGIKVVSGPGVYIRSLAKDIGEKLQTKAYLYYLRRDRVGSFTLTQSFHLEELPKVLLDIQF